MVSFSLLALPEAVPPEAVPPEAGVAEAAPPEAGVAEEAPPEAAAGWRRVTAAVTSSWRRGWCCCECCPCARRTAPEA